MVDLPDPKKVPFFDANFPFKVDEITTPPQHETFVRNLVILLRSQSSRARDRSEELEFHSQGRRQKRKRGRLRLRAK